MAAVISGDGRDGNVGIGCPHYSKEMASLGRPLPFCKTAVKLINISLWCVANQVGGYTGTENGQIWSCSPGGVLFNNHKALMKLVEVREGKSI